MQCLRFSVFCLLLDNLLQIHKAPIRFPGVWLARSIGGNESRTHKTYNTTKLKKHIVNALRPIRNGQHFADDIFKRIFFNENVWISLNISLKFVTGGQNHNIPALIQISHYLNHWWLVYRRIYASLGFNELSHWLQGDLNQSLGFLANFSDWTYRL